MPDDLAPTPVALLENRTIDEIEVGERASLTRQLRVDDIQLFAAMSGDVNPAHLDSDYARATRFHEIIAHGMWGGALISTVLGTKLPGPGTVYLGQTLEFLRPVHVDDAVTVSVTVTAKDTAHGRVRLACECVNQQGQTVIRGIAEVIVPSEKIRYAPATLPKVLLADHERRYRQLMALTKGLPAIRMAIVHPCDEQALRGAIEAASIGLVVPYLVGPSEKIRAVAREAALDIGTYQLIDAPHSHAAAAKAVAMARAGEVDALIKGSLHTDELMAEVVAPQTGLRTERRISHVFVLDVPRYPKPLLLTDAAINIEPSLEDKADIIRNAIDLAHALTIANPKVAILSAVETITPKLRSTLEAGALCKMADRGQITGAILDGPLAFDNAVSLAAAKTKGIRSEVAGQADILVVPNLEAGNMLAKQLEYLADAQAAGIVMGARVPIALTSRADSAHSRIASCALALLFYHHRAKAAAK